MKHLFKYILALLVIATACEPIIKDIPMGGVVDEDDLVLLISNEDGGNKVRMENKTPRTGSLWDYGLGTSTLAICEVVYPYTGEFEIKFTGLCDGGYVTTTRTVKVTKITAEIPETWYLFANGSAEGKEWTWNDEDWCYGTGSYGWETEPDWDAWGVDDEECPEGVSMDDYIKFDLDGGANFTSYIGGVETKGKFEFDMSAGIEDYSIGKLTLFNASVLLPYDAYEGEAAGIFMKFDIIELDEDHMVLTAALDGQIFQDPEWGSYATYWNFKAKVKEE